MSLLYPGFETAEVGPVRGIMIFRPQDNVAECTMVHPAGLSCGFFYAQI